MRRSILTSLVVIGAVLALVMGASTFAVFTETNTLTNDPQQGGTALSSGSFDLVLQDGESIQVLSFTPSGNAVCDNMADGDSCATTFTVSNAGSLEFTYEGSVTESDSDTNDCFAATVAVDTANGGEAQPTANGTSFGLALLGSGDGGNGDALDPDTETDSFTLTVTLTAPTDDPLSCQDQDVFYTVSVTATQSVSPQD